MRCNRPDLHEELSKGHHFYNIPLIAEQIKQPPMTDGKTQYAAEIDPAIYLAYVGKYLIQPDYVFMITTENGRLYYQAPDASHTELFPATRTKFFLRSLDANLIFIPGDHGKADEAILHVRGKDILSKRIEQAQGGVAGNFSRTNRIIGLDGVLAEDMGIKEVLTAPRSPWQTPHVERLIGSIRRECLDHVTVPNEDSLRRILRSYFSYYHRSRRHLSLGKDAPEPRAAQIPELGTVIAWPEVGGLHHHYERRAA